MAHDIDTLILPIKAQWFDMSPDCVKEIVNSYKRTK